MTRMFEVNDRRVQGYLQWLDTNGQPVGAPIPCDTEVEAAAILRNDPDNAVAYSWTEVRTKTLREAKA